ncbi:HD-GYP domain-containing protein [Pirellulaceae bacterium SH449]
MQNCGLRVGSYILDQDIYSPVSPDSTVDLSSIGKVGDPSRVLPQKADDLDREQVRMELMRAFPADDLARFHEVQDAVVQTLSETVEAVRTQSELRASTIFNSVSQVALETKRGVSNAVAALTLKLSSTDIGSANQMMERSSQLSSLGMALSITCGHDERTTVDIGIAGLLHDISLVLQTSTLNSQQCRNDPEWLARYRAHPLITVELLRRIPGISWESLAIIEQVHEQFDGTGFPRSLKGTAILPGARILNLVDAYLNLTQPLTGSATVFSDAVAYMCYHAARGKFDRELVRLFVEHMSMYPIGSVVELDDHTCAVVVAANHAAPMAPIVSINGRKVNLSHGYHTVERVATNGLIASHRVKKSKLSEIFWRLDM